MADTVFLVGTGAEDGAWAPVIQAIHDTDPNARFCQTPDHANFYMAKFIAVVRAACAVIGRTGQQFLPPILATRRELEANISARLSEAFTKRTLRLGSHFREVVSNSEWGESKVFVTTNWDKLIEGAFPGTTVRHVHGAINTPSASLFLPSDYAFDASHSSEAGRNMLFAQDACIHELWNARTVVIYGLGLDPIDGELAAICETGFKKDTHRPPIARIVIYNLEEERLQILDRVNLLLAGAECPNTPFEFRVCPKSSVNHETP